MRTEFVFIGGMAIVLLIGCATPRPSAPTVEADGQAVKVPLAAAPTPPPGAKRVSAPAPAPLIRTRHAAFRAASYDELPGWQSDNPAEAWTALRRSCEALNKRAQWKDICLDAASPPADAAAARRFFEARFTPLRVLGPRGQSDGGVTGYYEPLLEGRTQRDGSFSIPVMGTPNDLFVFDWSQVPAAQRHSLLRVKPAGNRLVQASAIETGTYALDLRRFVLDDRERRLRLRLAGSGTQARAEAYFTRAELNARGLPQGVDAPVLAWTNDPLSLYAMQVQGSGRMRTEGGKVIRLQYAEQNGHPFQPVSLAAAGNARIVTRGAAQAELPEQFSLEGPAQEESREDDAPLVTRGRPQVSDRPNTVATADGNAVLTQLLQGTRDPSPTPRKGPSSAASPGARLNVDPSYVFFKTAPDRAADDGPQGALGVPLTPTRSIAVDPRITPLGYPVFLNARTSNPAAAPAPRRLVFAQDTGGAIRGPSRADYFWGFGHQAGQSARSTKWRTEMWVLVPHEEARLLSANRKFVTRGNGESIGPAAGDGDRSCLLADGEFCAESAD